MSERDLTVPKSGPTSLGPVFETETQEVGCAQVFNQSWRTDQMPGTKPTHMWRIDRNGEYVFPEHQTSERFDAALDHAVSFAIRCAVIGLAP